MSTNFSKAPNLGFHETPRGRGGRVKLFGQTGRRTEWQPDIVKPRIVLRRLRKVASSNYETIYVCPSFHSHGTTRLPVEELREILRRGLQ